MTGVRLLDSIHAKRPNRIYREGLNFRHKFWVWVETGEYNLMMDEGIDRVKAIPKELRQNSECNMQDGPD
jgi:hypothetical protein